MQYLGVRGSDRSEAKSLDQNPGVCLEMHCVCLVLISTWKVLDIQTTYHLATMVGMVCFATLGIVAP